MVFQKLSMGLKGFWAGWNFWSGSAFLLICYVPFWDFINACQTVILALYIFIYAQIIIQYVCPSHADHHYHHAYISTNSSL